MTAAFIRTATIDDLESILRIERSRPTAAHWSALEYERLFRDPDVLRECLVSVSDNEQVLGFVIAREVAQDWDLENIAVEPTSSGKGIGSALLEALLVRIRKAGGARLTLEVRESNLCARRLYEKAGMQVSGRRKSYYANPAEDALLFEKKLA